MKFSVVIPTKDRPDGLKVLLFSLSKTDFELHRYEIIIVNNSITQISRDVVTLFEKRFPDLSVTYLSTAPTGPSHARNLGAKRSRYEHIIFLDDDEIVRKDFFIMYEKAWNKFPNAGIIGGQLRAISKKGTFFRGVKEKMIKQHSWCFGDIYHGKKAKILYKNTLSSGNLSLKKSDFFQNEVIFNENLGVNIGNGLMIGAEDTELCKRLRLMGKEIIYDPKIFVGNIVDNNRFSRSYLYKRYFLMGIEIARVELILKKRFIYYKDTVAAHLRKHIKNFITLDEHHLSHYTYCREAVLFTIVYLVASQIFDE